MNAYILDTNILIDHLRQHKSLLPFVKQIQDDQGILKISSITRAEIQAGASMEKTHKRQEALELLTIFDVVHVDIAVADKAGTLKRIHGTNLIDAFIAASALLTKSTLITRNTKHFTNIPQLKIETL